MTTQKTISGIHHVTAITADAQKNIDFYTGVLGLRLVKLTVNFDDPGSYHLYYGDQLGRPGTVLTFFAWPGAYRGRIGPPQVTATAFAAPAGALDYWTHRLGAHRVPAQSVRTRFGQPVLGFSDPDQMPLEINFMPEPAGQAWPAGPVPFEHALRGFHGVTISEANYERTAALLQDAMGFQAVGKEGNRFRYRTGTGLASTVDLLWTPDAPRESLGAGVVHHVAFRTPDDSQQAAWRNDLGALGRNVSPIMDRCYFHSIYFREPGGVLFEIATDTPGFTLDQPAEQLGTKLMLPPWFESQRSAIERILPPVKLPGS